MELSKRGWLLALAFIIIGSSSVLAQPRIQLVQGRRAISDKLTFNIEVSRDKTGNPRYATAPEDIQVYLAFADRPVSGMVYIDGKPLGRFDETQQFNSNSVDIAYGRHAITLVVANPGIVSIVSVTVRGGALREILDGEAPLVAAPTGLEPRIVDLERKVHQLEAEIATLKGKRAH